MQSNTIEKNYYLLDVMKLICALMLVCGHFISENYKLPIPLDYIFSLDIIAVPFFFSCSGYLLFKKFINKTKEQSVKELKRWTKRLIILYLSWSIIYLIFNILQWVITSVNFKDAIIFYLHQLLVYSSGPTIWFLPALIIAGWIVYYLKEHFTLRKTLYITVVLYVIGSLLYTYSFLIKDLPLLEKLYNYYISIFMTSRNGLFNAPVFVTIGALLAGKHISLTWKNCGKYLIISVIMFVFTVFESFIIKSIDSNAMIEFTLLLVPCTYYLLKSLISVKINYNKLFISMRKLSTEIFVSQRIILTAIPGIAPILWNKILTGTWYFDLTIVLVLVILFSQLIILLSKKIKCFEYLV